MKVPKISKPFFSNVAKQLLNKQNINVNPAMAKIQNMIPQADKHSWDYKSKGEDWKPLIDCSGENQSPIPLCTKQSQITQAHKFSFVQPAKEFFEKKNILTQYSFRVDAELFHITMPSRIESFPPRKYVMRQFHYHIPAEHTVDELYADVEFHFVTENPDAEPSDPERFAVFGFLLKADAKCEESLPKEYFDLNLEMGHRQSYAFVEKFFKEFLENPFYFSYNGSLTTPPCSEQVKWFVCGKFFPISYGDFFKLIDLIKNDDKVPQGNNRKLQPVGNRKVYLCCGQTHEHSHEENKN